jgi:hypothetical protein
VINKSNKESNHNASLLFLVIQEDFQYYSHPVTKIVTENSIKSPLQYNYQSTESYVLHTLASNVKSAP